MNSIKTQTTFKGGRLATRALLLFSMAIITAAIVAAKPTPLSFHSDLNYLVRALETYHPNPWQNRKRRAFRQDLTDNPNILNSYPVGPILKISRALSKLDGKQQDSVTGLNLFQQNVAWQLLPVEFLIIGQELYLYSTSADYAQYNGLLVNRIGGVTPNRIIGSLKNNFPARDKHWFQTYLRITDVLHYFGARCRTQCELVLESQDTPKLLLKRASFKTVAQAQPQATHLIEHFMATTQERQRLFSDIDSTLRWVLYDNGLASSLLFNDMATQIRGMMRDRNKLNLIVDLRGIHKTDPILERRFVDILKEFLALGVHRKIYAVVDTSTGTATYKVLNKLDNMPEVVFVGQSTGLALATYQDSQVIELPSSKLKVSIARRYERLLGGNRPEQRFIPDQKVSWQASDFFAGQDSYLDATMMLIEVNESD